MKTLKIALCAAVASLGLGFAGAALADDAPALTVAYNVGVANEYVFRGISNSAGKPEFFGGADASYGMFYAGIWSSNVEFGDGTDQEVDLYGGFKPVLGPVTFDLGLIYYGYISDPKDLNAYWEGKIAASMPVGPGTLGAAVYYSPRFPYHTGKATYGELNGSFPVGKFTIGGAIGYQDLDEAKYGLNGYTTGNIGVTYPLTSHVSVDVRYIGTDSKAKDFFSAVYGGGQHDNFNAGSSGVVTLKASF